MAETPLLGAVAYDPKVIIILEGFAAWFAKRGLDFVVILYSNYERQVESHFAGNFHIAWNSPLAWLQTERIAAKIGRSAEAIAMRDTDCDLTSVIVVNADSSIKTLDDLHGKSIAVGAADSPQATLIPLLYLEEAGVGDLTVRRFDTLVGKHGDHIGGERDAARALVHGEVDAAAMIDGNHFLFVREGTLPQGVTRILAQTGLYDHCNFTVLDGVSGSLVARFRELILSMSYDDSEVRSLLDLEGLKVWKPGRTEKYALLSRAIERFHVVDDFVERVVARWV